MLMTLFYVKECLGRDYEPIQIRKFRTMIANAEAQLEALVHEFGRDSLGKPLYDPRITPVGRLLRRYWVDELPQLVNLVQGDLKLVGIRPKTKDEWYRYPNQIMDRALQQKPGLVAIQYGLPKTDNFGDNVQYLEDYLNAYDTDPVGTDRKYFMKTMSAILLKGVRSK